MNTSVGNLTEILGQELESFGRFLTLLDEQHRRLVKRDLGALGEVNAELDVLSNQLGELERHRLSEIDKLSQFLNLDAHTAVLSNLLNRLDSNSSGRLIDLRAAIIETHKKIEEKSLRNKFLIDKSRQLISESMKIIAKRPSPVYQNPSKDNAGKNGLNLVNRSA